MTRVVRCALPGLEEGPRVLDQDSARYLVRVHRLKPGDRFVAFDPLLRTEADATLTSSDWKVATCNLTPPRAASLVSRSQITLLQGIGKGDKAERVIRDATQLGAEHIVLVQSERSVPRVKDKQAQRQQRYERVALEAARQCGRGDVPRVTGPVPWLVALAQAKASDFRLAFDAQAELLLKSALVGAQGRAVAALVGPEGGLTETERESACQEGFSLVRLGAFVLRTETAAVAALAAIAEHL